MPINRTLGPLSPTHGITLSLSRIHHPPRHKNSPRHQLPKLSRRNIFPRLTLSEDKAITPKGSRRHLTADHAKGEQETSNSRSRQRGAEDIYQQITPKGEQNLRASHGTQIWKIHHSCTDFQFSSLTHRFNFHHSRTDRNSSLTCTDHSSSPAIFPSKRSRTEKSADMTG